MRVLGVDPGIDGALALYDTEARTLDIEDMPVWETTVGRKVRRATDGPALHNVLWLYKQIGCELVVLEDVGGRPAQSAPAAFTFGVGWGRLAQSCIALELRFDTVTPTVWKKVMNVPGKAGTKALEGDIITRVREVFGPQHDNYWLGPKGGYKIDRAEAALLAYYGAKYIGG